MGLRFRSCRMRKVGVAFLIGNVILLAAWKTPAVQAQEARPAGNVIKALESEDPGIRLSAVLFLANLGPKARERLPGDADAILKALREAGPAIAKLARDPDVNIRRPALLALAWTRASGSVAAAAWLEGLKDKDASVRVAAAGAIGNHIERTADEVGRSYLRTAEWLAILAQWAQDVKAFADPLAVSLRDSDPLVQKAGLQSLSQLLIFVSRMKDVSPQEAAATPEEAPVLQENFLAVKKSLPALGAGLKTLTPQVIGLLKNSAPETAVAAAEVVEQMAELIRETGGVASRGRLLKLDLDPEGLDAAKVVRDALQQALPGLSEALDRKHAAVQLSVLDALEMMDASAKGATPALTAALRSESPFVRWSAARILGKLGPTDDSKVVQELAHRLQDDDIDVRLIAGQVLEKFGRRAAVAVPLLSKAVNSLDSELQEQALKALTAIGAPSEEALPSLIIAARSPEVRVRRLVAPLLGKFGPDAKSAVPALQSLLADDDLEVRQAAAQALLRIQGFSVNDSR